MKQQFRHLRQHVTRWRLLACALVCVAIAVASATTAGGASSTIVVTSNFLSHTTLDSTGCQSAVAGKTDFGSIVPGSSNVTGVDCTLAFGSNNDTSSLRMFQSDQLTGGIGLLNPNWTTQVASGANATYYSVGAFDANRICVSGNWVVTCTTNGGTSWATWAHPGPLWGITMSRVTATTAWVVGDDNSGNGEIRKTTNNGGTGVIGDWPQMNLIGGPFPVLNSISMPTDTVGYAVGNSGTALRTTNGIDWSPIPNKPGAVTGTINSVYAVDANNVFIGGSAGMAYRITNASGAAVWTSISASAWAVYNIMASDTNNVVLAGDGGFIAYSNNCATTCTWTSLYQPTAMGVDALGVAPGANTYMLGGGFSTLLKSTNGTTWTFMKPSRGPRLYDGLYMINANQAVAVGDAGVIEYTSDGGTSWNQINTAVGYTPWDVDANGVQNGVVVGTYGTIRSTSNGGTLWTTRTSNTTNNLFGVELDKSGYGWAVGDGGTILRTPDNGVTWTTQSSGVNVRLFAVHVLDQNRAVVVGVGGTILRTGDGGTSWSQVASGTTDWLMSIDGVDEVLYTAGGPNGTVLRSADGGQTWVARPAAMRITSIAVGSDQVAYIVGSAGTNDQKKTVDGGLAWTNMANTTRVNFKVDAVDTNNVMIGELGWGQDRLSSDQGVTYTQVNAPGSSGTSGLVLIDASTAYAVGRDGWIGKMAPSVTMPEYASGSNDWDQGAGLFGICLRDLTGAGNQPVWTKDANNICGTDDVADAWYGPPTTTGAGSVVARSTTSGVTNVTANLRFGLRVPANQTKGQYRTSITADVIAPML